MTIAASSGLLAVLAGAMPARAAAEQASQPVSTTAGGLDVGRYHACALLGNASVRCWGYGGDGALGYAGTNTIGDDETPGAAGPVELGAGRAAIALSAGSVHTCALLNGGAVRCWGFGGDGRLGYLSTNAVGDDESPGAVGPVLLGDGRTATAITAGRAHTCVVLDDRTVRCWGFGFDGRLGYGDANNIGDDEAPGAVGPVKLGDGRVATAITAGDSHTCALLDDRAVRCWGLGANGRLGYASTENIGDNETPDAAGPVRLGRPAIAITAGAFHTCALLDDGSVRCWGFGGNGRLGYANTQPVGDDESPEAVGPVDLGRAAVAISAGSEHTCAVLDDGTMRCWGSGDNGRLGYANTRSIGDDETPGPVGPVDIGTGRRATAISASGESTCSRLDDDSVRCWGEGANGRLGYCNINAVGDDETPGSVGPVDLGIPGRADAACAGGPGSASPPGSVGPAAAPGPSTPMPGSRLPALAPVGALAAQRRRASALRACLRQITRRASDERRRARRRSAGKRGSVARQISRRATRRRRGCLTRHGRTPGRVTALEVRTTGRRSTTLTFRAAGTELSKAPAAHGYVIKQSRRPIRTARGFRRADALCKGTCSFRVSVVGAKITLNVTGLRRRSTYYYAVAARDNVSARTGQRSKTVTARTR